MGNLMDRLARLLTGATAEERVALVRRIAAQQADAHYQAMVDDLITHEAEDERAERVMANLASLRAVPPDELPADGSPARTALVWLMSIGADVYVYPAYRIASTGSGTTAPVASWVVWLQPLAEARAGGDGRVTLAVRCAHWPELLNEMGVTMPTEVWEGMVTA